MELFVFVDKSVVTVDLCIVKLFIFGEGGTKK